MSAREASDEVTEVVVREKRPFGGGSLDFDVSRLTCLDAQVGGHRGIFLSTSNGWVLKRCLEDEIRFYRTLQETGVQKPFFAASPGTLVLSLKIGDERIENVTYLVMENLTHGYRNPCVMDIKVGTRPWGVDVVGAKLDRQLKKLERTTSKVLGFRLTGMKVWSPSQRSYNVYGKDFGHDLTPENMQEALEKFFQSESGDFADVVVPPLLQQLDDFKLWLESYGRKKFAFLAVSLLLIYDGDIFGTGDSDCFKQPRLAFVDFPHTVYLDQMPDSANMLEDGVLFGVDMLLNMFQGILEAHRERKISTKTSDMATPTSAAAKP
mmetsp:Transcript_13222/g.40646  ORF Transcript_13222/g.40646 Transcript_13222/m.40646 type:complete len:322 (-) Transcript_13222:189-1154(-)